MAYAKTRAAASEKLAGSSSDAVTVTEALMIAKGALNGVRLKIVGEVSYVSNKSSYSAVYFSIKDEGGTLDCMVWKDRFAAIGVDLKVGALVELTGHFGIYVKRGSMSFEVRDIKLAGEGYLRMQVANLARKLEAEGLMDSARKRPLPAYPEVIGIVTSPVGAAVHDVLRTLRRRYPLARVLLAGVIVEGDRAAKNIVEGMRQVVVAGAEVVLVVRGGGSYESMMPYNDELLARTIARCPVPVVTGIGHEPDNFIADMVADVRCSTPTGAAETVAPSLDEVDLALDSAAATISSSVAGQTRALRARLDLLDRALPQAQKSLLSRYRIKLDRCSMLPPFREPKRLFDTEARTIDDLAERLSSALPRQIERDRSVLDFTRKAMRRSLPRLLVRDSQRVVALADRLGYQAAHATQRYGRDVSVAAARLHNLSPLTVLARGYAMAQDADGTLVKSVKGVKSGDEISVLVGDGALDCRVSAVRRIDTSVENWRD